MRRMTTLKDHDRRINSLEDCVRETKEILAHHGESIYELKRKITKHDLRWVKLFEHFDIQDVSEQEVDEILDGE